MHHWTKKSVWKCVNSFISVESMNNNLFNKNKYLWHNFFFFYVQMYSSKQQLGDQALSVSEGRLEATETRFYGLTVQQLNITEVLSFCLSQRCLIGLASGLRPLMFFQSNFKIVFFSSQSCSTLRKSKRGKKE